MRKIYRFKAKQGQCAMVCRILKEKVGKPHVEMTEDGLLITVPLPKGVSKRSIDRLMFANMVPGAKAKDNQYKIVKGEKSDVLYGDNPTVENGDTFIWVNENGKFQGKFRREYVSFGCDCCGGYYDLVAVKKSK